MPRSYSSTGPGVIPGFVRQQYRHAEKRSARCCCPYGQVLINEGNLNGTRNPKPAYLETLPVVHSKISWILHVMACVRIFDSTSCKLKAANHKFRSELEVNVNKNTLRIQIAQCR